MNFFDWFLSNIYSNLFTLFTVILSGVVSLLISKYYYDKGNRNNLKMNVIHPICRLLKQQYNSKNYSYLVELSKDYSIRYMKKDEIRCLNSLINAYKDAVEKSEESIYSNALFSYFEAKLKRSGVETKFIPIEYEGDIIGYDYHPDLHYLYDEIYKIIKTFYYEDEFYYEYEDTTEYKIKEIFSHYSKNCYNRDDIKFFDDYSLDEVLEKSKHTKQWENKIEICNDAAKKFLNLKICKK